MSGIRQNDGQLRKFRAWLRRFIPHHLVIEPTRAGGKPEVILSFSLMRTGQHLVIEYLCRGMPGKGLHLNLCGFERKRFGYELRPLFGRTISYHSGQILQDTGENAHIEDYAALGQDCTVLLYSMETRGLDEPGFRLLAQRPEYAKLLILRDPANWLASSLKHRVRSRQQLRQDLDLLKGFLRRAAGNAPLPPNTHVILYERFLDSVDYRKNVGIRLNAQFSVDNAEPAMTRTPDFGKGSSFGAAEKDKARYLERWRHCAEDAFFRKAMDDAELGSLVEAIWGSDAAYFHFLRSIR